MQMTQRTQWVNCHHTAINQDRFHVSSDVHLVAFSDVRHHTIVRTIPPSALFGTEAETVKTLSMMVDCFISLRQRRGRPSHLLCCASTIELAITPLTQNATNYVNYCWPHAVTLQRDMAALYHSGRRGQRDGTQLIAKLEAIRDHGEVETPAHFSGPSRRAQPLQRMLTHVCRRSAVLD